MDRVNVGRLQVDCAVPSNHPSPLAVRTRLDDAAQRLPAALAELLAPLAKLGDEVIIIRKLELSFELDTSLDAADLARAWAAKVARELALSLHPEAPTILLRFTDEAHYLSRFLADSVSGPAMQRWYYKRWHGLSSLSLAAQLRTALTEEPVRGMAALAKLSRSELVAVLTALGPSEARHVLDVTIAGTTGDDYETAARALIALVPEWLQLTPALPSAWQAALALVARAVETAPAELRCVAVLAAALAALQRRGRSASTSRAIAARLDDRGAPSAEPLLTLPAATRRELLAMLDITDAIEVMAPATGWYTRLGGLLLLLPRLAELGLDEMFGEDAGCARLVLLSRAAGHVRRNEVLVDPLWRRLCGAGDADVDAWLHQPDVGDALTAAMWRHGASRAQRLRVIVTRHVQPLLIVASEPDGDWLSVTPLTPPLRRALRTTHAAQLSPSITHASARAAAQTLTWLDPDVGDARELAWTLAAQQMLRAFARRLPGFAESSPQFLYDSFLDFDATVLEQDDTFHCRVGRPRLAAVFGLTGALRGRLPIGDGRALELYPA